VGASPVTGTGPATVSVRAARPDDVGWILELDATRRRTGLSVRRDRPAIETWLARTAPSDSEAWESLFVAETGTRPVGWLRTAAWVEEAQYFLLPGAAPDITVARHLLAHALDHGQTLAERIGRPLEVLASDMPGTPWSRAVHAAGRPRPEPSGYYVRVPDEVALLSALTPVLSQRLASSGLARDRGELLVSLYDRGVVLAWEEGRIVRVEAAAPDPDPFDHGGVGVAPDWFPALVLGRWGATGLAARTDDTILGDHEAVMDVLFPARPNDIVTDL